MPRFFFSFWDHKAFVRDPYGAEFSDLIEVERTAARKARQLLKEGEDNNEDRSLWRFEITDEADTPVLRASFADVAKRETEKEQASEMPPAGPHARPELMNPDATPGAGTLAPIGVSDEPNLQPTS